jgi:urea transporter
MEDIFKIAGPIGLIVAIATALGAVFAHLFAIQLHNSREEMRRLRVGLEKDPSPAQMGEALRMWPEATKFTGAMQMGELRKNAHAAEMSRASKAENIKGMVRVFFFISAIGIVLFIVDKILASRAG